MGQPDQLLGYPIEEMADMPELANGSLSIVFANFKEAYTIVDRIGIRTLRDPYTQKPLVLFYTTKRVGGDVTNFDAIKLIQFS
jgi:HK97 family phage major capsid protein